MTARPVRRSESAIGSRSSGTSVRGSITSASIPSAGQPLGGGRAPRRPCARGRRSSRHGRGAARASGRARSARSSSGAGSRRKYSDLFSTNTTGLGSAIAAASRPPASAALDGITTLSPGTWVSHASRLCECWAAGAAAGPALGPQDHRHRQLAAGHEVGLGRLVDELVQRQRDEVDEHDLHHRAHARLGGADRRAAHGALADRGVAARGRGRTPPTGRASPGTGRPRRRPRRARSRARRRASPGRARG